MTSSFKSTIMTILVTVGLSISGGWLAGTKQQAEHAIKIQTAEKRLDNLSEKSQNFSELDSRLITLEVRSEASEYHLDRVDNQLINYNERIRDVQISNVQTSEVLKQFTVAVDNLSTQTVKLSEVVARLDERVKNIEREEQK